MAKELKYLKKVLTEFVKDVKLAYTTMWERDEAFQLPRTDGYNAMNTRPKVENAGQRDSRSMMMCCMSMCFYLGRGALM